MTIYVGEYIRIGVTAQVQTSPDIYEDLVAASDHRPVWVDLEVPGAPTASGAG